MNYNYCLATVSSREFLKGTQVMISSFIRKNPWFAGDIVIISEEIKILNKKSKFKKIKKIAPGKDLTRKIELLTKEISLLKNIGNRFNIFEIFRLTGYERVVYIDSDIVIRGNLKDLFYCNDLFCAPPDPATYLNKVIEKSTYKRMPRTKDTNGFFLNPFSTGVLSIPKSYINETVYQNLLGKINPGIYKYLADTIADGYILNHTFADKVKMIGPEYNYIIHLEKAISESTERLLKDSLLLHFTGPLKPWKVINQFKLLHRGKRYIKYLFIWNMEYFFSLLNKYI